MNVRIVQIKSGDLEKKIYTGNNIDDESPAWCMWGGAYK